MIDLKWVKVVLIEKTKYNYNDMKTNDYRVLYSVNINDNPQQYYFRVHFRKPYPLS